MYMLKKTTKSFLFFLVCRGCKSDVVMLRDVHIEESSKSFLFFLVCRGYKSDVVMLGGVHINLILFCFMEDKLEV